MIYKKKTVTLITLLFLAFYVKAQKVVLDSTFTIEISEIKFKKTAGTFLGGVILDKGDKVLIIDGVISSNVDKKIKLPLYKMILKTNSEEYMAKPDPAFTPYDDTARFIKVKKKIKTTFYIVVKDSFVSGDLFFDNALIGNLTVFEDTKRGELTLK